MLVQEIESRDNWHRTVDDFGGYPFQYSAWGELKRLNGWRYLLLTVSDENQVIGGAQVLLKPVIFGLNMAYLPRGPIAKSANQIGVIATAIAQYLVKHHRALVVVVEPDIDGEDEAAKRFFHDQWLPGTTHVLSAATLILDLEQTESELLAAMRKKHRQYIRKSVADNPDIRPVTSTAELRPCLAVYHETSKRADFGIYQDTYYETAFTKLGDHAKVWAVYQDNQPTAFLFLAHSKDVSYELYGGMTDAGKLAKANYALKWHAIKEMQQLGVKRYDFGGLIEGGITQFKTGFADHTNTLIGTFEYPGRGYWIWRAIINFAMPMKSKLTRFINRLRNRA